MNAFSVAKEFVKLSYGGEEPDPLTHLRLQKLLYYAHGWSMVVRDSDLFPEDLQAWAHGPVVPDVYHDLKRHRDTPIVLISEGPLSHAPDLSADEAAFVRAVWESYSRCSASELRRLTHKELAWAIARGSCPNTPSALSH